MAHNYNCDNYFVMDKEREQTRQREDKKRQQQFMGETLSQREKQEYGDDIREYMFESEVCAHDSSTVP